MSSIIKLAPQQAQYEHYPTPKDKLIEGPAEQHISNLYSDPSGQFHVGFWGSEPGSWQVSYDEHEYCQLLEGEVEIKSHDGAVMHIKAGEQFVIPAGFKGVWHTIKSCKKTYVIFEKSN
ncbi:cupin domain-containing protein [Paraferrimonas sp. SM1919]|uniref:cupin domain-containing protein n=1 Tax=Paraferrimonas sp. SM1919 TaxID=2662263 RepID=UPI0013D4170D|nr:cupin domain-containing protein [Paraferrimonas sp. SM1919]